MRCIYEGGLKIMEEKEKDKIINQEKEELKDILGDLEGKAKIYAERLIDQAAFMYATLYELQEQVNKEGAVTWFEQGSQKMWRENPAAKTYNTMIRNYTKVIKQMGDITPGEGESDELMDFLKERK